MRWIAWTCHPLITCCHSNSLRCGGRTQGDLHASQQSARDRRVGVGTLLQQDSHSEVRCCSCACLAWQSSETRYRTDQSKEPLPDCPNEATSRQIRLHWAHEHRGFRCANGLEEYDPQAHVQHVSWNRQRSDEATLRVE